jgi:hypothetical protein
MIAAIAISYVAVIGCSDESSADPSGGSCGDNVTYSFVEGKLVISGTGPMYDYSSENPAPWRNTSFAGVEIGNGVTHIGAYSFYYSTRVSTLNMPDSVTSIGTCAFYCSYLTQVSFSSNLTTIGYSAFANCSSLGNVEIPSKVTSVNDAFCGCDSMTAINVSPSNNSYCSVDGVLFNKSKTVLVQYPAGKYGAYTVPDGVTSISGNAFYYCPHLTSVTFPDSLTTLSERFSVCSSITSVTFGSGLTSVGPYIFEDFAFLDSDGTSLEKTAANLKDNVFVKYSSAKSLMKYSRVYYVVDGETVFTDVCAEQSDAVLRERYQKEGYTVSEWNTGDTIVVDGHFTVDKTKIIFTATSAINYHDVIYKVDGVAEITDAFAYGTTVTVRGIYEKTGYTVSGWTTSDV